MKSKREETIQAYRQLLEQHTWDLMGNFKVTSGIPSKWRVRRLCGQLIAEMRERDGGKDFRYFCVFESGISGNNPHVHILIGGLRNRKTYWEQRWAEMGGDAVITRFDPEQKGVLYMLKGMSNDGDLDCDFDLPTNRNSGGDDDGLAQEGEPKPTSVRVDCIDGETTTTELKRLFKKFGRIVETGIVESRTDRNRTVISATITFSDPAAATKAAEELDGVELRGLSLRVSVLGEPEGNNAERY